MDTTQARMAVLQAAQKTGRSVPVIERYYDLITASAADFDSAPTAGEFEPSMDLPVLDARLRQLLAPATARFFELGFYRGIPLRLLDLRQNPETQTAKTLAATLIVARAVRHIQACGDKILLFCSSSGNHAVALRDAVLRALKSGLVECEQLRIVTLTPFHTLDKLRRTELYDDPALRALNPVFVLDAEAQDALSRVGQDFKDGFARRPLSDMKLWQPCRLETERFADQTRAFFDFEHGDAGSLGRTTVHVQAVSGASGFLGYCSGMAFLRKHQYRLARPQFLLVQHLATSDMVLHLLDGNFSSASRPGYVRAASGLWEQSQSVHFPGATWSPAEVIDPTFYSHLPATAREMSDTIIANGGSGIVVSLYECMRRYGECLRLLSKTPVRLPVDPRDLTEWSLVMTLCGCLNAIDRQLLSGADGCTIHACGSYSRHDYEPIPLHGLSVINSAVEMLDALHLCRSV